VGGVELGGIGGRGMGQADANVVGEGRPNGGGRSAWLEAPPRALDEAPAGLGGLAVEHPRHQHHVASAAEVRVVGKNDFVFSFGQQADRVHLLDQQVADVRDQYGHGEVDARRVNLNNILMATGAEIATLRLFHWIRFEGGERAFMDGLRIADHANIRPMAEDMLRVGKHFLLLEAQFQIETLLRNIHLTTLGSTGPSGFYNLAKQAVAFAGLSEPDEKLERLNLPALIRNSKHSNGIHDGYKGRSTSVVVDGVEFLFEHGKAVRCGHLVHIVIALSSSVQVVEQILTSEPISGLALIPDRYAQLAASEAA